MSRPKKATVDYFPHLTDHGKTMFILESKYGNDGYAAWFKTLEKLGKSKGLFLDCNSPATWELLQAYTRVFDPVLTQIFNTLACLEAIDPVLWTEHKIIYSQNFVDGVTDAYKRRKDVLPTRHHVIDYINSVYANNNPEKHTESAQRERERERETKDFKEAAAISPTSVIETGEMEPASMAAANKNRMGYTECQNLYTRYAGKMDTGQASVIQDVCRLYPPEAIREAFQAAGACNPKPKGFLNWVRTRLESRQGEVYDPVAARAELEAMAAKHEQRRAAGGK